MRVRKRTVAAATTEINGKVRKAQKTMEMVEQSGEELKKTANKKKANKDKKAQETTVNQ